jgi:hypothetical protein
MRNNFLLFFLLLIFPVFFLFTGCVPYKDITLKDDDSLQKLNDLIKDKSIELKIKKDSYFGSHVIVYRDSTVVDDTLVLPTKELTTIYKANYQKHAALYGLAGGVVAGAVVGTFVGTPIETEDSPFGFSRTEIWMVSTCLGGASGFLIGMSTQMFEGWQNINITYKFDSYNF